MERNKANTQNAGAKAETKLNKQQRKPQTNNGSLRPNLSEMVLTERLPAINPAKITEVETNPREPRSQTRSNCEKNKRSSHSLFLTICTSNYNYNFEVWPLESRHFS